MNSRRSFLLVTLLALVVFGSAATAQWPADPELNLAIADRTSEQVIPKIGSTSSGGTYISWFDLASGSYDVYLQRLDREGVEQWAHNGILVSDNPQNSALFGWDMIVDSNDNAVIVFCDIRAGGDLDVFAYMIAPDGTFLWGADGIMLSIGGDFEPAPTLAEADDGDLVFVWPVFPDAADGGIVMQRLSPEGVPRFVSGGLTVVSAAGEDPGNPQIVPAEDGNVIVSWVRDVSTFFSSRHVRAQKFSPTGAAVWAAPVEVFDASSVSIAYTPPLVGDGNGGAVLVWHSAPGSLFSSYVQHLDAAGNELFAHNGVSVSTNAGMNHLDPCLAYHPDTGESIVFWNERNSSQGLRGIFAQKVTASGTLAWGGGGIELLPVDDDIESFPRCAPYQDGAMVFVTQALGGGFGEDVLIGIRVDGDGNTVWNDSPVAISSLPSSKSRYPLTYDAQGTVTLVWEDDRGEDKDLYAQNINADGSLGNPSTPVAAEQPASRLQLTQNIPNPFNPLTRIGFTLLTAQQVRISVYDLNGRRLVDLAEGPRTAGEHEVIWQGTDAAGRAAAAGTYIVRLQGEVTSDARKVMLVR